MPEEQKPNAIDAQRLNPQTLWQRREPSGNLGKEMVEPGKTSRDLLMRSNLRDENMAVLVVALRDYIRYWDVEKETDALVDDFLAAVTSIGGLARHQYTEISTGLMIDSQKNFSNLWGLKKRKNDQQPNS